MSGVALGPVVGVDVGGSKTKALVADAGGRVLGSGAGPGGNRQVVGADGFRVAVDTATDAALAAAGVSRADVLAVHIGAAGLDFPEDGEELLAAVGDAYPNVVVENDALLGLHAGSRTGWGGVVVGGSGTNAAAVAPDGRVLFVGGVGWHTGDLGGASMLGVEALRLAIRSWEEREAPTELCRLVVELTGAGDMAEVYQRAAVFQGPDPLTVAPLVVRAARDGDGPARELLERFGREMGAAVGTALRRLDLADVDPEVVAFGGLFAMDASGHLLVGLLDALSRYVETPEVTVLDVEPVVGAAVAALRRIGNNRTDLADVVRRSWREHVGDGLTREAAP